MTCVVGWIYDKKIYIGADNAGSNNSRIMSRGDDKVFIKDNAIYGFITSYRMGNLLRWKFIRPSFPEGMDVDEYINTLFIDKIRKVFKDGGFTEIVNKVEEGGSFIVGLKNRLYEIQPDFQVAIPSDNYCSVGCGFQYALASMRTSIDLYRSIKRKIAPDVLIIKALETSEYYSPFVRRPFKIMNLG